MVSAASVTGLWSEPLAGAPAISTAAASSAPDSWAAAAALAEDKSDLQALIDAAEPGDTIVVPPGTYGGGVVVDKPLTLKGRDWPVVDAGGKGQVIEVTAPDVTIEGLVIRGSGISVTKEDAGIKGSAPRLTVVGNRIEDVLFGVHLNRVTNAVVRDNRIQGKNLFSSRRGDGIRLWESNDSLIENNDVSTARDVVFWYSKGLTIRGNTMRDNRYGLHFMYCEDILVEDNVVDHNFVGAFLMYSKGLRVERNVFSDSTGSSGYGIGMKDVDGAELEDNRFLGNRVGIFIDNSPGSAGIVHHTTGNVIAFNEIGVELMPAVKANVFTDNAFMDNTEQVGLAGLGKLTGVDWSFEDRGNYWSDYAGYDADGNGIGDLPYRLEDLFSSLTDTHPALGFFTGTPAARAVDMAGRAFPDLRPDPKLIDNDPLVNIPAMPPMPGNADEGSRSTLLFVSLAMVAFGAAILSLGRVQRDRIRPAP